MSGKKRATASDAGAVSAGGGDVGGEQAGARKTAGELAGSAGVGGAIDAKAGLSHKSLASAGAGTSSQSGVRVSQGSEESKGRSAGQERGGDLSTDTSSVGSTDRGPSANTTDRGLPSIPDMTLGQQRVVLENLVPCVDGGRFAAKSSVGETVVVEIDAFTDGHDKISVTLLYRTGFDGPWSEVEMEPLVNDRWAGKFDVYSVGWQQVSAVAWVDRFATWRYDLQKRVSAGQDVRFDLKIGSALVEDAAALNQQDVAATLRAFAQSLKSDDIGLAIQSAFDGKLQSLMRLHGPRQFATEWPTPAPVWVDRARGRYSSWYEFFPRSASDDPARPGTLRDVIARLDDVKSMGFEVLYLPPIHPIGQAFRKGKNNSPTAEEGDVGSPWAIGGATGGHDSIHPDLGTDKDFDDLVDAARERDIDLALDLAFQSSPDHPYVKEHPEWFRHRPDGTIQYAENPPKKYQDIYPFDFECEDFRALWDELLRVTMGWVDRGVRVFRVDNPHTKPFPFWEWLIAKVKEQQPEVLFLAEAFTRPKIMYRLGKLGFSQSYTYFTWRNDPYSLRKYMEELTQPPVSDFYRPNAWPNTPDILPEYLQTDARSAYIVRAVLAATLFASYGVYGPAFELMDGRPAAPGKEEYLDSEKYQLRHWNRDNPNSLADLLASLNKIRRDHPALQFDRGLRFYNVDNPTILCYSKTHGQNTILVAVNTDPYQTQWGNIDLDLSAMDLTADVPFQVHDLLTNMRYRWQGHHQVVGLDPATLPVHVFAVRRRRTNEQDFEYFL